MEEYEIIDKPLDVPKKKIRQNWASIVDILPMDKALRFTYDNMKQARNIGMSLSQFGSRGRRPYRLHTYTKREDGKAILIVYKEMREESEK